jgi:hypothetical protein
MVRTSERLLYKKCRWAWDRDFNDRMRPARAAPALRFGSLVHLALERYYRPGTKRGPHPAKTFKRLFDRDVEEQGHLGFRDEDGEWADAGEMGVDLLEGYVVEYGKDRRWKVLVTEQAFQMPVLTPAGKQVAVYTGILDGVWQDTETGYIYIVDHKTAASISTVHLALDEQAGAYWTYGQDWLREQGLLKKNQVLSGMLYNFLRKAKGDTRPMNPEGQYLNKPNKDALVAEARRLKLEAVGTVDVLLERLQKKGVDTDQLGEVSKSQPPARYERHLIYRDEPDREAVRARVLEEMREMRLVRRGKLAAYKSPGAMNCGPCGYRDICELHESGHDWEEMAKQTMETWDPYEAHEIRAGEQH